MRRLAPSSLVNYFKEASYNAFTLRGAIHGWTAVPGDAADYGNDSVAGTDMATGSGDTLTLVDLVQHAADTIASDAGFLATLNLDDYASSGDVLDYFVVVHAGRGQESGGGALGATSLVARGRAIAPYPLGSTGKYVQNFIVVSEDAPLGVFVHMFGHLFGLPDTRNPDARVLLAHWDQGGIWGEPSPSFTIRGLWLLDRASSGRDAGQHDGLERIQLGCSRRTSGPWRRSHRHLPGRAGTARAQDKALKIVLPSFAYSGDMVRRAPDPTDLDSDSTLQHDFLITTTGTAELRWWQWYDLAYDTAVVEIRPSGAPDYTTLLTFTGSVSETWVQESIDLTPYLGQAVRVRFQLRRLTSLIGKGWFLDDFELWENDVRSWYDDVEDSDMGPGQGAPTLGYFWDDALFPRIEAVPYYRPSGATTSRL